MSNNFVITKNFENFKGSDGWLDRWKTRHSVTFKTVAGEAKSCTSEMTASWDETTLSTIIPNYKLGDIFNADVLGLFYQVLPNKTLHLKSEKCVGGKHSKTRLTGMAAANAVGEKLPMFVIGKSARPRCFAGVRNLPCRYRSQKKSWIGSALIEEWVRELDRKKQDLCHAIDVLQTFSLFERVDHDSFKTNIKNISRIVDRDRLVEKRQGLLTDYFSKTE